MIFRLKLKSPSTHWSSTRRLSLVVFAVLSGLCICWILINCRATAGCMIFRPNDATDQPYNNETTYRRHPEKKAEKADPYYRVETDIFNCSVTPPDLQQAHGDVFVTLRAVLGGIPFPGNGSTPSVLLASGAPRIGFMAPSLGGGGVPICDVLKQRKNMIPMRYGEWIWAQRTFHLGPRSLYLVVHANDYKKCAALIWEMFSNAKDVCWAVVGTTPKLSSPFRSSTHHFAMQKLHWPNYLNCAPEVRRILTFDLDTSLAFDNSLAFMWHRVSEIFDEHLANRRRSALMAASVEASWMGCGLKDKGVRLGFNSGVIAWDLIALADFMREEFMGLQKRQRQDSAWRWYNSLVQRGLTDVHELGDQNVFNMFARLYPNRFAVLDCNMNMGLDKIMLLQAAVNIKVCHSHHKERCCVPINFQCRSLALVYHFHAGVTFEKKLPLIQNLAARVHSQMKLLGFNQTTPGNSSGVRALVSAVGSAVHSESRKLTWDRTGCNPQIKGSGCCTSNVTNNSVCDVNAARIFYLPP